MKIAFMMDSDPKSEGSELIISQSEGDSSDLSSDDIYSESQETV